jgi:ureidoacrylate peracid hydrolase
MAEGMHDDILTTLEDKVAPGHTAVVVVDMQNDFCAPGGYYDRTGARLPGIQEMAPRLQRLLGAARRAGVPVIFVAAAYDEPFLSGVQKERHIRRFGRVVPCCETGSWGADFYGVTPAPGEAVVRKRRYSAFHGTELHVLLRSRGVRTVVLAGVATNVCVETAARDASMHDYYVVVVEDCTAARDEDFHRSALRSVEASFGVVASARALAEIWKEELR